MNENPSDDKPGHGREETENTLIPTGDSPQDTVASAGSYGGPTDQTEGGYTTDTQQTPPADESRNND